MRGQPCRIYRADTFGGWGRREYLRHCLQEIAGALSLLSTQAAPALRLL